MDQLYRIDSHGSTSTRSSTGSPVDSEDPLPRNFEFINLSTTGPTAKDLEQRKVVRAHVVKDFSRKRKLQRIQAEKLKGRRIQPSIAPTSLTLISTSPARSVPAIRYSGRLVKTQQIPISPSAYDQPSQQEEVFCDLLEDPTPILDPHPDLFDHAFSISGLGGVSFQAFDFEPQITSVLQHVRNMGTAMFPLSTMYKFNPVCCNGPIGWDVDDRAAYHGIMYVTSTYANLLSGRTDSNDAMVHMGKVVTIVNSRLREIGTLGGGNNVTEGLIGAVASIALAEALRGNSDSWTIHMSGVRHLIQLKGDFSILGVDLQHKLYRADLMGATTFLLPPCFSGNETPAWRLASSDSGIDVNATTDSPGSLLYALSVGHDLITALLSLAELSTLLSAILLMPTPCSQEQRVHVLEQTYSIQYWLLRSLSDTQILETSPVEDCFKIAAMLYMHVTWQDFPLSAMGTTKLLDRLRDLIARTEFDGDAEEHLLIWLLFIGATSARKGHARIWFVANIQRTLNNLRLDNWEALKAKLSCLWWVEKIHEKMCKNVFDEVVVLNGVLVGYSEQCALDS